MAVPESNKGKFEPRTINETLQRLSESAEHAASDDARTFFESLYTQVRGRFGDPRQGETKEEAEEIERYVQEECEKKFGSHFGGI